MGETDFGCGFGPFWPIFDPVLPFFFVFDPVWTGADVVSSSFIVVVVVS